MTEKREESTAPVDKIVVPHPGTGELITCETFEEAMKQWFEGWNVPRYVIDGKLEPFETSRKRVEEYFAA